MEFVNLAQAIPMKHFDTDEFAADELEKSQYEIEARRNQYPQGSAPKKGMLTTGEQYIREKHESVTTTEADDDNPYSDLAEYTMIPDFEGEEETVNTSGS